MPDAAAGQDDEPGDDRKALGRAARRRWRPGQRGAWKRALARWLLPLQASLLFCGDLALRAIAGQAMFPMAAPAGGMLLMGGWALLAISALLQLRLLPR